jgi:glucokinase
VTFVAGVDVGGTKIDACILDPLTGIVSERARIPSRCERGGRAVLAECVDLVMRLSDSAQLSCVGIGLCEFVSSEGRPTSAFTVDWRHLDLARAFADIAPVHLESDVRAGAIAESRLGAGREIRGPWLYVSVGTGISHSLVIDGRPFAGARGNAVVVGAPPVERVASGLALERATGRASAEEVLSDSALTTTVADAAVALGLALAGLINAFDPAAVVIGGGLGLVDSYRAAAVEAMRPAIEALDTRLVPVLAASLGSLAGPVGAGLAAADAVGV